MFLIFLIFKNVFNNSSIRNIFSENILFESVFIDHQAFIEFYQILNFFFKNTF